MKVEFRNGPRDVPDHVAELMIGIETRRFTYEEALAQANRNILNRHLRKVQDRVYEQHFENRGS